MIKNATKHIKLVTRHKWEVFKLCLRVGTPWRGLVHDLSKFSPIEFLESTKYYQGDKSPIPVCRREKGYSEAWLHHKGRNKHHVEYWIDSRTRGYAAVIPYKYAAEMACDKMAASIVYAGEKWTNGYEYDYWMKEREISIVNPKIDNFLTEIFAQVKEKGIKEVYTKQNFKTVYKKCCIDDKTEYFYKVQGEWKTREEKNV